MGPIQFSYFDGQTEASKARAVPCVVALATVEKRHGTITTLFIAGGADRLCAQATFYIKL